MGTIREYEKSDGTTTFHAEVRLRGYPPQRATFRTKSLAKKWIQDTESAIRDGRHFKTVEAKRRTVGEMIDRFIQQWLPRFPKRQSKQTALLTWWKETVGHLYLSDLKPSIVAEQRDRLLSERTVRKKLRSPSTVNRYLAALSKALSIAVKEWGWLDDSPMRKVTKPAEAPGRDRFLSHIEKENLLAACKRSSNPHLFPLVSLSILSGMRFSELINLEWSDVDFHQRMITLQETKNGDRRVIPLAAAMAEILKKCPSFCEKATGKIFVSQRRNRLVTVSVRKAFQKALTEAGIEGFRWHDLRHTAASYLAMNGATQGELMAILGHRSPYMTRRYAHYSQKHLEELMQRTSQSITKESQGE